MPTNRLGRGTVNVAVNLPAEERAILGRLSMKRDVSIGAIMRDLMLEGLKQHHPTEAMQVWHIRISRRAEVVGGAL